MDKIFEETDRINNLILKSDRTTKTAALKLMEELGEFVSADFALDSYKQGSIEHLQEETVDVLQNAISLYCLVQSKYPFDGKAVMEKKNIKWENKYIEKHE